MTFKSFPLSSDMVSVSDEDYNGISGGESAPLCPATRHLSASPSSPPPATPSRRQLLTPAHRILLQITAQIHRLDASHNSIGTKGAVSLFDGLASARRRFSSLPGAELWGMSEINLARNAIEDDGFAGAMYYVSKDQAMRSLYMQANLITVSRILRSGEPGWGRAGDLCELPAHCGPCMPGSLHPVLREHGCVVLQVAAWRVISSAGDPTSYLPDQFCAP